MTDNTTLSTLLSSSGTLDEARAVAYTKAIAYEVKQLNYAGPLTPDMVIIDNDGNISITTELPDDIAGSPYTPLDTTVSQRTTVYSLAAMLYRMLTGMVPTTFAARAEGEPLLSLPSSITPAITSAVERGLKLNANLRQPSPEALATQLSIEPKPEKIVTPHRPKPSQHKEKIIKMQSEPKPATEEQPSEPATREQSRLSPTLIIIVIVAVAIAATAGGAWWYFHHSGGGDNFDNDTTAVRLDTILPLDSIVAPDTTTVELNDSATVENMEIKNENGFTFTYTGPTIKGLPDGEGHGVYENGVYDGEYVAGVREGRGTFTTDDGENHFEGTFKADFYDEGKMLFPDSTFYRGTFRDSELYNGNLYDKKGTPVASVRAGVIQQ